MLVTINSNLIKVLKQGGMQYTILNYAIFGLVVLLQCTVLLSSYN